MSYIVTLTPDQMIRGASEGFGRRVNALRQLLTPRHRAPTWEEELEGATAELVVAIVTEQPWTSEGFRCIRGAWVKAPPDVGDNIEVRWVAPERNPLIRIDAARDAPDAEYWLVQGRSPRFEVLGKISGRRAAMIGRRVVYPERTVYEVPASDLDEPA